MEYMGSTDNVKDPLELQDQDHLHLQDNLKVSRLLDSLKTLGSHFQILAVLICPASEKILLSEAIHVIWNKHGTKVGAEVRLCEGPVI